MIEWFWLPLQLIAALLLDKVLGEPRIFHPLVGFGKLAQVLQQRFNRFNTKGLSRVSGVLAWCLLCLPLPVLILFLSLPVWLEVTLEIFGLYLCVANNSLQQHAKQIADALVQGQWQQARLYTSYMVSRDPEQLTPEQMCRASCESVLENGNDAVIASLFWFVVAGLPGVVLHRLANTLDAMWGYKNQQYVHFGWCAARMDDLLAYIPSWICSLLYLLSRSFKNLKHLPTVVNQARAYKSLNGGRVMAAGAFSLGFQLGGASEYQGKTYNGVTLGQGRGAKVEDIYASCQLVEKSAWLLVLLMSISITSCVFYV